MNKNQEALEILYRKDCCVQSPNPSCEGCKLGLSSKCKIYECYMQLCSCLDRLEKLEKTIFNVSDCNTCNIVESFKDTVFYILELIENNNIETAVKILKSFIEE